MARMPNHFRSMSRDETLVVRGSTLRGCRFASVESGVLLVRFESNEQHAGFFGLMHGGILCTTADAVGAVADDPNKDAVVMHVPITILPLYCDDNGLKPLIDIFVNPRSSKIRPSLAFHHHIQPKTGRYGKALQKKYLPVSPTFERLQRL